ncbi:MAG TPA: ShlB/FhaC/HecB family hemolysin secretion/activation protein [Marinobacter sp.]|nr:ShlB/FhaC/HecB family hemolysin secretion/activation protein [Marinobacter sp.]
MARSATAFWPSGHIVILCGSLLSGLVTPALAAGSWGLSGQDALSTREALLPEDSLKAVQEHWLRSRLRFSGRTDSDKERHAGTLNVKLNSLFAVNHHASLRYDDSSAHRTSTGRQVVGLGYGMPLGQNHLNVNVTSTAYDDVVRADNARYQKSGQVRDVNLTGSRSLFSWAGYHFLGTLAYNTVNEAWRQQDQGWHSREYQISTLGFEARAHHDLAGGVSLTSGLRAMTGVETELMGTVDTRTQAKDDQFERMLFSASLGRELYNWHWDLGGQYQLSSADLPGSQYLQVAGSDRSSGFNGQSLSVAEGGWFRLASQSPDFSVPFFPRMSSSLSLSLHRGWVPDHGFQHDQAGHVTAGEISFGFRAPEFSAGLSIGRVLDTSTTAILVPDQADVQFSMSLQI